MEETLNESIIESTSVSSAVAENGESSFASSEAGGFGGGVLGNPLAPDEGYEYDFGEDSGLPMQTPFDQLLEFEEFDNLGDIFGDLDPSDNPFAGGGDTSGDVPPISDGGAQPSAIGDRASEGNSNNPFGSFNPNTDGSPFSDSDNSEYETAEGVEGMSSGGGSMMNGDFSGIDTGAGNTDNGNGNNFLGDSEGESGSNNRADGNGNWFYGNDNQADGNGNWNFGDGNQVNGNGNWNLNEEGGTPFDTVFAGENNPLTGGNPLSAGEEGGIPTDAMGGNNPIFAGGSTTPTPVGEGEIPDTAENPTGNQNTVNGNGNWNFGSDNDTSGNGNWNFGDGNNVTDGNGNWNLGDDNEVSGNGNRPSGNDNNISGNSNRVTGDGNSINGNRFNLDEDNSNILGNGDRYFQTDTDGNVSLVSDESAGDSNYTFDFEGVLEASADSEALENENLAGQDVIEQVYGSINGDGMDSLTNNSGTPNVNEDASVMGGFGGQMSGGDSAGGNPFGGAGGFGGQMSDSDSAGGNPFGAGGFGGQMSGGDSASGNPFGGGAGGFGGQMSGSDSAGGNPFGGGAGGFGGGQMSDSGADQSTTDANSAYTYDFSSFEDAQDSGNPFGGAGGFGGQMGGGDSAGGNPFGGAGGFGGGQMGGGDSAGGNPFGGAGGFGGGQMGGGDSAGGNPFGGGAAMGAEGGEQNSQSDLNELIRQSPFGVLLDIPGIEGVEDIFGNVGGENPFGGGAAMGASDAGGGENSFGGGAAMGAGGGNPFANFNPLEEGNPFVEGDEPNVSGGAMGAGGFGGSQMSGGDSAGGFGGSQMSGGDSAGGNPFGGGAGGFGGQMSGGDSAGGNPFGGSPFEYNPIEDSSNSSDAPAGSIFPVGEVPEGLSNEELAVSSQITNGENAPAMESNSSYNWDFDFAGFDNFNPDSDSSDGGASESAVEPLLDEMDLENSQTNDAENTDTSISEGPVFNAETNELLLPNGVTVNPNGENGELDISLNAPVFSEEGIEAGKIKISFPEFVEDYYSSVFNSEDMLEVFSGGGSEFFSAQFSDIESNPNLFGSDTPVLGEDNVLQVPGGFEIDLSGIIGESAEDAIV